MSETFEGNHPEFSMLLNDFLASRASVSGLPPNTLHIAYDGYGQDIVSWDHVVRQAHAVHDEMQRSMPEVKLDMALHPSNDVGQAAVGVSAYHMHAAKMEDGEEAFFNGATHTFVFWRWGVWLLQTNDVVGSTGHFHRRVMSRDKGASFSFTGLHDSLSSLWPTMIEVGQRRRRNGIPANLTFFPAPYSNGLISVEFQKLRESSKFHPVLKVLDKNVVTDYRLNTPFSNGDDHLLVLPRTYLNVRRLNSNQKKVSAMLVQFLDKHRDAAQFLRRSARLLYDSRRVGSYMRRTFNDDRESSSVIDAAIDDLDAITSSSEWLKESDRIRKSVEKNAERPTLTQEGSGSV